MYAKIGKRGPRTRPQVRIEEGLRHVRGIIETAQAAIVGPNVSAVSVSDALSTATMELDHVSALIAAQPRQT